MLTNPLEIRNKLPQFCSSRKLVIEWLQLCQDILLMCRHDNKNQSERSITICIKLDQLIEMVKNSANTYEECK